MELATLIHKARKSNFYLWLLNRGLSRKIPFNMPHKFEVTEIGDYSVTTRLPFRRKNLNHIKGLHACALATISEFTTGLTLLVHLDPSKYRIILKTLEMEYHYQGKTDVTASFEISPGWLEEKIYGPLKEQDAVVVTCPVKTFNTKNEHISTGKVHWQVKSWNKVRTKI